MITLDTLKTKAYGLLTSENDEQILEIIETAYRLGSEDGYDKAKENFTPIILELMNLVEKNK